MRYTTRNDLWCSTHNDNNVCIFCYKTYKANYKCPECGRDLISMSHKIRVPKHRDNKAWKKFIEIWIDDWPYYTDQKDKIMKKKGV
jgi:predicted RNA-binding Zn-ribbon protein involved in translation (DUF1610 family)